MTLRRLFPQTKPPASLEECLSRARSLYREWLREIPRAVQKYPLDVSVAEGRARVRRAFAAYGAFFHATETAQLEARHLALLKGTQELIEVHNRWSQKTHLMRWFEGADEPASPLLQDRQRDAMIGAVNNGIGWDQRVPESDFIRNFLLQNKNK